MNDDIVSEVFGMIVATIAFVVELTLIIVGEVLAALVFLVEVIVGDD
ncbi:hypothetical protein [Actinomadura hibisca]|nr:hypothetical protein [Actinomadura hibisca]